MSDKFKRRFWQFHLSTAILLMFFIGCSIWANSRINNAALLRQIEEDSDKSFVEETKKVIFVYPYTWDQLSNCPEYGWPVTAFGPGNSHSLKPFWRKSGIAIDLLFSIGILFVVAFASEWLIRRREGRMP